MFRCLKSFIEISLFLLYTFIKFECIGKLIKVIQRYVPGESEVVVLVVVVGSVSGTFVVKFTGKTLGELSSILGSSTIFTRRYLACELLAKAKIVIAREKRFLLVLQDIL